MSADLGFLASAPPRPPSGVGDKEVTEPYSACAVWRKSSGRKRSYLFLDCFSKVRWCIERGWNLRRESLPRAMRSLISCCISSGLVTSISRSTLAEDELVKVLASIRFTPILLWIILFYGVFSFSHGFRIMLRLPLATSWRCSCGVGDASALRQVQDGVRCSTRCRGAREYF